MSIEKKKFFPAKRLVVDAVLIALYVVLGFWKIPIGNLFRISPASFAVILCAMIFGPVDGLIVGFMGEFLSQILGPYGLTQTTLLWCLGEGVRGLSLGLCVLPLKKRIAGKPVLAPGIMAMLLVCLVLTSVLASLCNTLALYVDSKLFGYYNFYMVFGVLLGRLAINGVMSVLLGYIALPIIRALQKTKLI